MSGNCLYAAQNLCIHAWTACAAKHFAVSVNADTQCSTGSQGVVSHFGLYLALEAMVIVVFRAIHYMNMGGVFSEKLS